MPSFRLYAPMLYTIALITIILMVAIRVGKYRQNSKDRRRFNLNLDTMRSSFGLSNESQFSNKK